MSGKNIGVNFNLKFEKIQNLNPSFDIARIHIGYHGVNRNKCVISKEVFEDAVPSLFNVPLVGRYIPEDNDFGSHDVIVVPKENGGYSIENATVPFGVVPESAQVGWVTVTEENGEEKEYLYADCLIWKRSYGYETLVSQKEWNQSMEITVTEYELDINNYMVVKKMNFTALCILGNNIEPCFESASVQMSKNSEKSSFKNQFSLMVNDLKELIDTNSCRFEFDTSTKEGGDCGLNLTNEIRDEILVAAGLTLDDINFEITEDMTREDFEAKIAELTNSTNEPEDNASEGATDDNVVDVNASADADVTDDEDVTATDVGADFEAYTEGRFSATFLEMRRSLENALNPIYEMENGRCVSETYFWLCDFDKNYAYVEKRVYNCETGDSEKGYGRFSYVFSEETKEATVGTFEEMIVKWLTLDENAKIEAARSELFELRDYKTSKLAEEHKSEIDAYISENFAKVSKTKEFSDLGDVIYELDKDALEEKLFAIKGRLGVTDSDKSQKETGIKIPINAKERTKEKRYGDLFERFAKNN